MRSVLTGLALLLAAIAFYGASCGEEGNGGRGDGGAKGDLKQADQGPRRDRDAKPEKSKEPKPKPKPQPVAEPECDPNYEGACLDPNASDYDDCEGGEGDGPKYTGPVTVVGTDRFDLDEGDGDPRACELSQ